MYKRVTQFAVSERIALTKLLQKDCQGLANINRAVQLLKQLHVKNNLKLSCELEARFEPIKPGQGPFSRPPPEQEMSVDPDTTSMEDSQPSGLGGAFQLPTLSQSGKSGAQTRDRNQGSGPARGRSMKFLRKTTAVTNTRLQLALTNSPAITV